MNLLIIVVVAILLLFTVAILILFTTSVSTKNRMLQEKQAAELAYQQEINRTKLEIQDETMSQVGRDLHDNLGQLLSVIKLQSASVLRQHPGDVKMQEIITTIDLAAVEVKSISKSLNNSRVADFGLHREIINETQRINKTNQIAATFEVIGIEKSIASDKGIMLYRIIQEFLSNSLKYSQAKHLVIRFAYADQHLKIELKDDGIGFHNSEKNNGSGLMNIQRRAVLLKAEEYLLDSSSGNGTKLSFTLSTN